MTDHPISPLPRRARLTPFSTPARSAAPRASRPNAGASPLTMASLSWAGARRSRNGATNLPVMSREASVPTVRPARICASTARAAVSQQDAQRQAPADSADHAGLGGLMGDPQHHLRVWLSDQLSASPGGRWATQKKLAACLNLRPEAVTRMANIKSSGEVRRIEAHHIPVMVAFFGSIPPGFDFMVSDDPSSPHMLTTGYYGA